MGLHEIHRTSINSVDSILAQFPSTRRLSQQELKQNNWEKYSCGWIIKTNLKIAKDIINICLLVKKDFPYSLPIISSTPKLECLKYPHVEKNGTLCVWSKDVLFNPFEFGYIKVLVQDAYKLLGELIQGNLHEDFKSEFYSYWDYHSSENEKHKSINLCILSNKVNRNIVYFYCSKFGFVFAENRNSLEKWLHNYGIKVKKSLLQQSHIFCLEQPWSPSEYPKNIHQLLDRLINTDEEKIRVVESILSSISRNTKKQAVPFLISFKTPEGNCCASVLLSKGFSNTLNGGKFLDAYRPKRIMDGYAKEIPKGLLYSRISNLPLIGLSTHRADREWVFGRDKNKELQNLTIKSVVIIGTGAVGSTVARLLIQSGVKKIVLIDDDLLLPENTSRHELGMRYYNQGKARSLAKELMKSFPSSTIDFIGGKWQEKIEESLKEFKNANTIISCTADNNSDLCLLDLQTKGRFSAPILFGFTEAHAVSGHVIANFKGSGAYCSLYHYSGSNLGNFKVPVSEWDSLTTVKTPQCGGSFQPYGVVELMYINTMITDAALDIITGKETNSFCRTWIGKFSTLTLNGGKWNKTWIDTFGEPGKGNYMIERKYISSNWVIEE